MLINPLYAGPFLKVDRIDSISEFPKIKVYLTIRNSESIPLLGLDEDNILVYEDGYRVNYVKVKNLSETDSFLYIVYSMDSSKSISKELLLKIKNEASRLLSSSNSNDMIAIYRFNDNVELMNNFTNNRAELIRNLKQIERHGTKTMLFDAIYSSIRLLELSEVERKAVIVFTDGKDEGSSVEIDDIVKLARETSIPVYAISLKPSPNTKILSRISRLTGGVQFNIGDREITDVYRSIIGMINRQYIVDYQSMLKPDGNSHKLELRLKYGSISDREQRDIKIEKRLNFLYIPSFPEIALISLIIILVIIIIVFFIYTLRKLNMLAAAPVPQKKASIPAGIFKNVTEEKFQKEKIPEEEAADGIVYSNTWLVERDGNGAGKKILISTDEFTIGSDPANSIVIDGKAVSPKHAKIKKMEKAYYLFDLASDNGTYLNENKLLRPKLLYDWDEIRVGKKIFIFRGSNIA